MPLTDTIHANALMGLPDEVARGNVVLRDGLIVAVERSAHLHRGAADLGGDLREDLPRGIATITRNPADAAGLHDSGRIAPGLRAELVHVHWLESVPIIRGVRSTGRKVG